MISVEYLESMIRTTIIGIVLLFVSIDLLAQQSAGEIDTSYGVPTGANNSIIAMALQSDGKLIIGGGFSSYNGTTINQIARLNTDGTIDLTFNVGSGFDNVVYSLAIQTDGKIIVGGAFTTYNGTARNRIARLNSDGSLDTSFNPGSGASNVVYAIGLQVDGKVVIGGIFETFNGTVMDGIARLNSNGTVDTTFNPGTGISDGTGDRILSLAIQSDGKIIIGGDFLTYNDVSRNRHARINSNGSLDTSFTPVSVGSTDVTKVYIQTDSKFLIGLAGSSGSLRRYNSDGSLDGSFTSLDVDGVVDVIQDASGKLLVCGSGGVKRLNNDGTLDNSFQNCGGINNQAYAIKIQSDGKLLVDWFFAAGNEKVSRLFNETVAATEPTNSPTGITFSSIQPTTFTTNFTAASGNPSGYIAIRKTGSLPTTDPVDGTTYSVGTTVGDGTVVYVGNSTTFAQSGLTAATTYHYKIYAYNGSCLSLNYKQLSALQGSQSTLFADPTHSPSVFSATNVVSSSATISYSAATGNPSGYIALRAVNAVPDTDPGDGISYLLGQTLGNSIVAYVGSSLTFNETSLEPSTGYNYKIYSFNGSGSLINYKTSLPLTGSLTTTAVSEPTAQPTNLLFSSVASTSMIVSYTAAAGSPAGYIAVRKSGSAPTTDPVDGTAYTLGTVIGDGTIAYVGSAVTFNETGLTASTTYHYKIYSYNGSGATINYRQTSPLTGSQTTSAGGTAEPTAQPTNLLFSSVTSTSLTVSYTAATGSPAGYIAVRKSGSAPTSDPVDGTAYTVGGTFGDGTIAFVGSAVTFNETGLTASTTYHYKIYSYNGSGATINYRQTSPLTGSQTTSAGGTAEPTAQPTNLVFTSVTSTSMTISYTAAAGSPVGYIAVRKSGSAPTADPVDGTAYTLGTVIGDGTIAYVGSAVTFNETGLTAGTTYHYKIYSYNGSGATINYRQTSPLTGSQTTSAGGTAEPTAQPTNLVFSSVTSTSMTASYTAATGSPAGYIAVRKSGSAPTTDPVDGTAYTLGGSLGDGTIAYVGSAVTFNETGLTASTTYHYKIYSYNGSGAAINYLQTAPLTGSQITSAPGADTTPPQAGSNTTPDKVASGSTVNVSIVLTDTESGVTDARISYGPATSGTFSVTEQAMTNTSGTWSFTIPASAQSELGVRYRVVATNGANLTTTIGPLTIGIDNPSGVAIPYTAFGSAQSNYRIIALPLNLTNKTVNSVLGDNLGNYGDQSKWRMFRYSSGQTQELNGSSTLDPGRGYWLIATESKALDTGPGQTSGSVDAPVTIPVTQGWNQIGNPYGFNLAWSDITAANSGLELGNLRVYRTGSGFADATTLNTSEGGFAFANKAGTLTFSAEKNPSVNGRKAAPAESLRLNSPDGEDWEVRFTLQSGTSINELGGVGMHPQAQFGFDAFDDFTLPRFGTYLELNHEKKLHGSAYSRDIVNPANNYSWQFNVEVAEPGPVTLQWSNFHLQGSTNKLVLWDAEARLPVNMERTTEYKFNAPRRFALHYGDAAYLYSQLGELEMILSEPYPNPTAGNAAFQIWVPESGDYILDIIDPLGRVVETLLKGNMKSGSHRVLWQRSEPVSPGLYLVKLSNSRQSVYQKLVIR